MKRAKGIYVLTFKEKDGPNDNASAIDRDGIYRVNLGVSKARFRSLFGSIPTRPHAGSVVATGHDFTNVNTIMPHPVYGWMSWICVLNPQRETFDRLKPLIEESVGLANEKYVRKVRRLT